MDQWAFLVVGVLAVAAAWDYGRRLTQKIANAALEERIAGLERKLDNRFKAISAELSPYVAKVDDLEAKLKGLSNKTEAAAAVNRPRGGFPRIG